MEEFMKVGFARGQGLEIVRELGIMEWIMRV
jgi:hypothetical protein